MSFPNQGGGNDLDVGEVAGIPVRLSPWFLVLVIFAFMVTRSPQDGVILFVTLTVSLLGHELGHGLVAKHYGLRPAIVLHAMGGYCQHAVVQDRRRNLRIVAAGPAASFAMALLAQTALGLLPSSTPDPLAYFVAMMAQLNLFWFFFNALPVLPMDGGRLLQLMLGYRVSQTRADGISYWTGMIVGVLGAGFYWLYFHSWMAPIFLGLMAFRNYQMAERYPWETLVRPRRNEIPAARNGPGFELPRPIMGLAAVLLLVAVLNNTVLLGLSARWALLVPSIVLEGQFSWTVLTAPLSHSLVRWSSLGWAWIALFSFGPAIYRVMGGAPRFFALYLGALLAGSAATLALAAPLGHADQVFYGAGAGSAALLVAWARYSSPEPVLPGVALVPTRIAAGVLALDVLLGLSGVASWAWFAHLAGAAMVFVIPPPPYDNVLRIPQDGQWSTRERRRH